MRTPPQPIRNENGGGGDDGGNAEEQSNDRSNTPPPVDQETLVQLKQQVDLLQKQLNTLTEEEEKD